MEKPDPRIFAWMAEALGVEAASVVHIGDSVAADVRGALGAGMRAIWYLGRPTEERIDALARDTDRVAVCSTAAEVREALQRWGLFDA
jgi:FMN phosphatase YigB (HAD superfamily)